MHKLKNGIHLQETPFSGNDLEIHIINQGGIMDHIHGIVGIQHLIEHKAFTFNNLNIHTNASTSLHTMAFYITEAPKPKQLLKILQMWFCKVPNGIKLAHKCSDVDIQRCAYEIDNEYIYRTTSYDIHNILYYILMNEKAMNFCGNQKTFDVAKVKKAIDNLPFVPTNDIVVLYSSKMRDEYPVLEKFFSQFEPYKQNIPKVSIPVQKFYGLKIQSNTQSYQILFTLDGYWKTLLDYLPIFVYNVYITCHPHLNECYIVFTFFSAKQFEDFLFLLGNKLYYDLTSQYAFVDTETFIQFIKNDKGKEMFLPSTDLLLLASDKIEKIFNHLHGLYKKGEFVVLGPYSDFTAVDSTLSGEPVKKDIFNLDFTNYIYDHKYRNYMMANYTSSATSNAIVKWDNTRTHMCFQPNLESDYSARFPQKDTSLEETIRYLIQFVIKSAPIVYNTDQKELSANEKFDIQLKGAEVLVKTRYDFTLFLMRFDKNSIDEFYPMLHKYLYSQKDLGNIYYFRIHFIKFQDYSIVTLFSNPSDFNKWKNSMISFFQSFNFTSYYLIQSTKSKMYDLKNLSKTTVVSF